MWLGWELFNLALHTDHTKYYHHVSYWEASQEQTINHTGHVSLSKPPGGECGSRQTTSLFSTAVLHAATQRSQEPATPPRHGSQCSRKASSIKHSCPAGKYGLVPFHGLCPYENTSMWWKNKRTQTTPVHRPCSTVYKVQCKSCSAMQVITISLNRLEYNELDTTAINWCLHWPCNIAKGSKNLWICLSTWNVCLVLKKQSSASTMMGLGRQSKSYHYTDVQDTATNGIMLKDYFDDSL